jgi:hypothetical protein
MDEYEDASYAAEHADTKRKLDIGDNWDPELALEALGTAKAVYGEDEARVAEELFRQGLPMAAMTIIHASKHSNNERLRVDAAKYVVERNLGAIKDANPLQGRREDPLMALVQSLTKSEDDAIDKAKEKLGSQPVDVEAIREGLTDD